MRTAVLIAAFAATIPAANWLIGNVGTECIPNGPCIIPVGFGYEAPSGVLMIGAAMVLRDVIQQVSGARAAVLAVTIGGLVSWFIAPPALVVASVSAFVFAELANMLVYTPLRRNSIGRAILAGGIVGSVVDSALFLWLAFGSLNFIAGQVIGKAWMSIIAYLVLAALALRRRAAA